MKRIGYIKEQITHELAVKAIRRAMKGKRKRREVRKLLGWDVKTRQFTKIDEVADLAVSALVNETWEPHAISEREIIDGGSGKTRLIGRVPFFDQIIHWLLILAIKPVLFRGAYPHSVACVQGGGAHKGRRAVERWLVRDRKNTKYYLTIDVTKFYPSVTPEVAERVLRRLIKDEWLFRIFRKYTATWVHGMPIGHLISQNLANVILTPTDHFIKEKLQIPYYLRYMDDMRLYASSKRKLHKARKALDAHLAKYGLSIKGNWQVRRQDSEPNDVMGFVFKRGATLLRKRLMLRISRKARRVSKRGTWNAHNCRAILSYMGWIKHTDSYGFFVKWVKPFILTIGKLKGVIRRASIKHNYAHAAV